MSVWQLLFSWKYLVFLLLSLAGLGLLCAGWTRRSIRALVLGLSFFFLGGIAGLLFPLLHKPLGLHPSPMCALNKLVAFGWLQGKFYLPLMVALAVILFLSLAGRKLFCGWVCPLGALQELLYLIPGAPKVKNLPFRFTNLLRFGLFILFLVGLGIWGVITFDYINAFEILHWEFNLHLAILAVIVLVPAFFYYRPFCYLVCPIGLISWLLEPLAPLKVRVDQEKCTHCGLCFSHAPCDAIHALVEGKKGWISDCTSCGLCMNDCPPGAIRFGFPSSGKNRTEK